MTIHDTRGVLPSIKLYGSVALYYSQTSLKRPSEEETVY